MAAGYGRQTGDDVGVERCAAALALGIQDRPEPRVVAGKHQGQTVRLGPLGTPLAAQARVIERPGLDRIANVMGRDEPPAHGGGNLAPGCWHELLDPPRPGLGNRRWVEDRKSVV